ncbi:MAG TPA: MFS transporter [Terriglobales bacterium]|nr:MFS transporter [Terriglobales bacterium]
MLNAKVKALLYADIIWLFAEGMLGPLFAVFSEKVGGNVLNISWAWATYLLVTGVMMVLVGMISDNMIKKEVLVVAGYVLNALLTFAYLLVSKPDQLLLVQAGLGVAAALATPTWNALYSKDGEARMNGSKWGLADGMSAISTGIAIIVGGVIVTYASFSVLFLIMGTIQMISVTALLPIFKVE